jgi:DNA-binding transcriptional LysR family regulator
MEDDLNDMVAFMAVARERNFTRAAAQLSVSQSALSRTVRALEDRMGAPLLVRTTRSVSLTDAGERLIGSVGSHVQEIRAELDAMRSSVGRPTGRVRITSTPEATGAYVWPRIQNLLREYPEIQIEIVNDYGLADIVADRFDIGVRLGN